MKIAVIGAGYVGLVTGVCFAEMGNSVTCIDIDNQKISRLNAGISPIFEPGLQELLTKNIKGNTLFFTEDLEKGISQAAVIFIAVGTPMNKDGKADVTTVFSVAKAIGKFLKNQAIIASKSTVPVGTTHQIQEIIKQALSKRKATYTFEVASNPEFLKEGAAVQDFMKPDRIVIGAEKEMVFETMKQLYRPFFRTHERFITMDIPSAEMTKYAANAMLATKISFINEMATLCEKVGADINKVRIGIGSDSRIGYDFIYPGIGYGGTCFPKDIAALIEIGKDNGYFPGLISAVNAVNKNQKKRFLQQLLDRFSTNLSGKTFAIWGLSFKPETDDMRESPAIYIIKELIKKGAEIRVYDPKAIKQAKNRYFKELSVFYAQDKYEALTNASALLLLTEWKTFRSPDFETIKKQLKHPIIFDGRNQYKDFELTKKGFEYHQIGKK